MFTHLLLIIAALLAPTASQPPNSYAEGQVWEYRHRPQDNGSLLKIQKIEAQDGSPIYHISLTGVRIAGRLIEIQHLPVSDQTLNDSVTRKATDPGNFPSADEGIAQWRKARGGVFTIPLNQVADVVDQTIPAQQ